MSKSVSCVKAPYSDKKDDSSLERLYTLIKGKYSSIKTLSIKMEKNIFIDYKEQCFYNILQNTDTPNELYIVTRKLFIHTWS